MHWALSSKSRFKQFETQFLLIRLISVKLEKLIYLLDEITALNRT